LEKSVLKYKPSELLCGIDGGGSITKVVVCNLEGKILHSFQTETINHYGAGIGKVTETFAGISANLMSEFGCLPEIIFAGNSALDGRAEDSLVKELTNGVFRSSKVVFHSDVYIALMGFTMGNPGAVLISGTGSMACGIDENGVYHTAGGWGHVLGDEGSGYCIALEGIKAALRAHDGLIETTQLTTRLMRYFNLKTMAGLIDRIYNPAVEKSVIAGFAVEVAEAADKGDPLAKSILKDQADWLYKLALVITNKCKTKNLGYYGSVLTKNEMIRSELLAKLTGQAITLQAPQFKPEIGALISAFYELGNKLSVSVINNLKEYK